MQVTLSGFDDYQEKAFRTLAPDTPIMQLLHCVNGIAGEVVEIRRAELTFNMPNEVEEIGDTAWYSAVLARLLNLSFDRVVKAALELGEYEIRTAVNIDILTLEAGNMLDVVKRHAFYKGELDVMKLTSHLCWIVHCLNKRVQFRHQLTLLRVGELNITKLALRYKGKFSEFYAFDRDLSAEASVFSGSAK